MNPFKTVLHWIKEWRAERQYQKRMKKLRENDPFIY